jgi:hypothetical protein
MIKDAINGRHSATNGMFEQRIEFRRTKDFTKSQDGEQVASPSEVEDAAWIVTQMAHLDLSIGKIDEAEKLSQQALTMFPGYHYALGNLAKVRIRQNKNPRIVYWNMGNGQFKDVSSVMGPGISEHFSSRGAAFGDYDNDGDVDALVLNMNDLPSLLRNDGGNK